MRIRPQHSPRRRHLEVHNQRQVLKANLALAELAKHLQPLPNQSQLIDWHRRFHHRSQQQLNAQLLAKHCKRRTMRRQASLHDLSKGPKPHHLRMASPSTLPGRRNHSDTPTRPRIRGKM